MDRLRVFVSYSHEDHALARQVVDVLQDRMGFLPLWDANIQPGTAFNESIKSLIFHAHLFLPLLTGNSQHRPWVHQETGYALALGIPVLPIAVNTLPGEMIAALHAIQVKPDMSDLEERLRELRFERIVLPSLSPPPPMFEVADWPEQRTERIARYANRVVEMGAYGCIRQHGAFSSFSIPDEGTGSTTWCKYDGKEPRSEYYHYLQQQERRALEQHARACGAYLIIDPSMDLDSRGPRAIQTRLEVLLQFLTAMPDEKITVVMTPQAQRSNATIVGDWFIADSQVPRRGGYRQIIFNWHAPTVLEAVRRFDEAFQTLYTASGLDVNASRQAAIEAIKGRIHRLANSCGAEAPHAV